MFNFGLVKDGELSLILQEAGIVSFNDACRFVADINYGRISNVAELDLVYHERRGTCSSKHAFLKRLAEEQENTEVKLMLGMFKMSAASHPELNNFFNTIDLDYIPEAHIYLKINGKIEDYTTKKTFKVEDYLLLEKEVDINFVLNEKVKYHREFLNNWNDSQYTFDEIWSFRENCIDVFSKQ